MTVHILEQRSQASLWRDHRIDPKLTFCRNNVVAGAAVSSNGKVIILYTQEVRGSSGCRDVIRTLEKSSKDEWIQSTIFEDNICPSLIMSGDGLSFTFKYCETGEGTRPERPILVIYTRETIGESWIRRLPVFSEPREIQFPLSLSMSFDGKVILLGLLYSRAYILMRFGDHNWRLTPLAGNDSVNLPNARTLYPGATLASSGNVALICDPYDDERKGACWVFARQSKLLDVWSQQGPKYTAKSFPACHDYLDLYFGVSVSSTVDASSFVVSGWGTMKKGDSNGGALVFSLHV